MDNLESNTNPSGEADVTASQGQLAATETQPVTTENSVDGATQLEAGAASNPWDNDPRFKGKAPEDIYKAYTEAEKLNGQLSQKAQVANIITEKYGVTPEQLKAQIEQQERAAQQERYANNPLAPIEDKVAQQQEFIQQLQQEKAMQAVENELNSFLESTPDYKVNREELKQLILTPGIGYDLQTGQEIPLADIANRFFGKTRAQGQQDAYQRIEMKQQTHPTGVSSGTQKQFGADDMKTMSVAELEAILPRA